MKELMPAEKKDLVTTWGRFALLKHSENPPYAFRIRYSKKAGKSARTTSRFAFRRNGPLTEGDWT